MLWSDQWLCAYGFSSFLMLISSVLVAGRCRALVWDVRCSSPPSASACACACACAWDLSAGECGCRCFPFAVLVKCVGCPGFQ